MARQKGMRRSVERERFWRGHVTARQRSGESVRGYCRAQGLSEALFHYWKGELKRRDEAKHMTRPGAHAPQFAEVTVSATLEALIEISCANARRVEVHPGFDEATLARVLSVLERTGC